MDPIKTYNAELLKRNLKHFIAKYQWRIFKQEGWQKELLNLNDQELLLKIIESNIENQITYNPDYLLCDLRMLKFPDTRLLESIYGVGPIAQLFKNREKPCQINIDPEFQ